MASLNGFNAEDHQPLDQYDPIPPNKYEAMIVASERKLTRAGDGEYLKLTWQITSGEYDGRKVFDNCNLLNPNAQAVDLGMRQLATICRAVGKPHINDSEELHDVPCIIDVKIRPAKGDYAASNDIKGYEPIGGGSPAGKSPAQGQKTPAAWKGGSAGGQAANAAPAASGTGKPPWARK